MHSKILNICQVSLKCNIDLILKNYLNFIKFYKDIKIFIICPSSEIDTFKSKLNFKEFEIIDEETLISLNDFTSVFENLSTSVTYKNQFKKRIKWYYQQVLKISFVLNFVKKNNENIIIWDADTILIKKINFFKNNLSIMYGNFNEFHKQYYVTNNKILKAAPNYFISFLNQFIGVSVKDSTFLKDKIFNKKKMEFIDIPTKLSKLILNSIFSEHKEYNGSLFSEYELIGHSNYLLNKSKQIPILTLRYGLNGILTNKQVILAKFLNFRHVTYEHSYTNKNSLNMLDRNQDWLSFIKIILKSLFKYYFRLLRHNFRYLFYSNEKN